MKELNARNVIIDPVATHKKFQKYGLPAKDLNQILQEIEKLPSDRLDAELKARILTFFKGFGAEATLNDTKALFVSTISKEYR